MNFIFWSDTNERLWQDAVDAAGFDVRYQVIQSGSRNCGVFTGNLPDSLIDLAKELGADIID
jgi:hypothetical protein